MTALAVDPAGLHDRWRQARRDGAPPDAAVRTAVAPRVADLEGAADRAFAAWRTVGVRVAVVGDPAYPRRLTRFERDDAPLLLARRGPRPSEGPAVAIVGSRRATAYGRGVAAWLAEACAESGVRVVSGGAIGIDAAAHESAHAAVGTTTVVLGCGHDVPYPAPHAAPGGLFERIVEHGGALLSELLPGSAPKAHRVRARNRIVAALVDAVVVVEGGERSGALLTAGVAADLGVPVFAVPGDIRAPGSAAPHQLLAEGAGLCRGPQDLLDELSVVQPEGALAPTSPPFGERVGLPEPVAAALVQRWPRSVPLDELAALSGLGTGALLAALTRARMAGTIAQTADGVVLRRRPSATTGRNRH